MLLLSALLLPACAQQQESRPLVEARDVIATVPAAIADRPNNNIIMADDLGSYGSRAIRTPHIDSLAAEGIRFTDFNPATWSAHHHGRVC
jgi:hypothetical protein